MDSSRALRCGRRAGAVVSVFILATWGASVVGHVVYGSAPGATWWGVQISGGVLYLARSPSGSAAESLTHGWTAGANRKLELGFVGIGTRMPAGSATVIVLPLWVPFAAAVTVTALLFWWGSRSVDTTRQTRRQSSTCEIERPGPPFPVDANAERDDTTGRGAPPPPFGLADLHAAASTPSSAPPDLSHIDQSQIHRCPQCQNALSGVLSGRCPTCGVPCYFWLDRHTPIPSRTCAKCHQDLTEGIRWRCPRCGTAL